MATIAQIDVVGAIRLAAGVALLLSVVVDALITTTAVSEYPGPLTRLLSRSLWRGFRAITTRSESALLRAVGSSVLLSVITTWVLSVWLGWTLILSAVPGAIVHADSGQAAGFVGVLYFTATSIATTGVGDLVPTSGVWRVLTGVASLSGLGLITLAVTYLVPVIQAGMDRLHFAQWLNALGGTPHDILVRGFDGATFEPLMAESSGLIDALTRLHAEHLAFPVLHFQHGGRPGGALAPRLAALDEALTLLSHGVAREQRPKGDRIEPLRDAIGAMLDTLVTRKFAMPEGEEPPAPPLQPLRARGIATVTDDEFRTALRGLADRRCALLSYVRDDSWSWDTVNERAVAPGSVRRAARR